MYSLSIRPFEAFDGLNANKKNKSVRRKYARRVKQFLQDNPISVIDIENLFVNRKYQTLFSDIIKSKAGGLFDIKVTQNVINRQSIKCVKTEYGYVVNSYGATTIMEQILTTIFPDVRIDRMGGYLKVYIDEYDIKLQQYLAVLEHHENKVVELKTIIADMKSKKN